MAENTSDKPSQTGATSATDAAQDLEQSHGISINLSPGAHDGRPQPVKHMSAPLYQSPIRHHKRAPSRTKGVKETLNARSSYGSGDDEGPSVHRINQYVIKQEIGRGSFGAVHLATDQYGNEFAVKEFSKSRLRKRAQSNLLRKPNAGRRPGHLAAGLGFNSPMHRLTSQEQNSNEANNSLSLIKEEIAIMKKLNHNNLVSLIEVLDDPEEDSLYMVLEMCKKGVAMKVGLEERADPYDDETCRCWFRDMILGIEYLHHQGIIHRDIKPDNCLITNDDVLKIVDFGVSEIFEKQSEMSTVKSAGSPAFMPPELCVAKHGPVSGRAADIWSMGVTLYCLRYGHIPFEKGSMLELYDCIRKDKLLLDDEQDPKFADLIIRTLEKDPEKRITMEELREHPWVTKDGADPLLPAEENCADVLEPPTEAEMHNAITGNMAHLLTVMSAAKRFKKLVSNKRGRVMEGIFGRESKFVAPPNSIRPQTRSQDTHDRRPLDTTMATEGVHRPIEVDEDLNRLPSGIDKFALHSDADQSRSVVMERSAGETSAIQKQRLETQAHRPDSDTHPAHHRTPAEGRSRTFPLADHAKGHAHNPLEDTLFLHIGASDPEREGDVDPPIVSESPPAVDMNIYEQAYQEEMQRILSQRGGEPSMYMTRRVEHRDDIRSVSAIKDAGKHAARSAAAKFDDLFAKTGASRANHAGGSSNGSVSAAVEKLSSGLSGSSATADKAPGDETWKDSVKTTASDTLEASKSAAKSASEKFGGFSGESKSTGTNDALSSLIARVQSKGRGGPEEEAVTDDAEQQPQSDPQTAGANSSAYQENVASSSIPGGLLGSSTKAK